MEETEPVRERGYDPARDPENWGCFVLCLAIAIFIASFGIAAVIRALHG